MEDSQLAAMATYYHYTNSESLVKIVKEKMLLSSEGTLSVNLVIFLELKLHVSVISNGQQYG